MSGALASQPGLIGECHLGTVARLAWSIEGGEHVLTSVVRRSPSTLPESTAFALADAEWLAATTTLSLALKSAELHATRRGLRHLCTQPWAVANTVLGMAGTCRAKTVLHVARGLITLRSLVLADGATHLARVDVTSKHSSVTILIEMEVGEIVSDVGVGVRRVLW